MQRLALVLILATGGWLASADTASAQCGCDGYYGGGAYYGGYHSGPYPAPGGGYYHSYNAPGYAAYYGSVYLPYQNTRALYGSYYGPHYGGYSGAYRAYYGGYGYQHYRGGLNYGGWGGHPYGGGYYGSGVRVGIMF